MPPLKFNGVAEEVIVHYLNGLSDEERAERLARSIAKREETLAAKKAAIKKLEEQSDSLMQQISMLEKNRDRILLQILETEKHSRLSAISARITGRRLLLPHEIVGESVSYEAQAGVYFLIKNERVIYVGQSTNVFSRVSQHRHMGFDRFCYVPLPKNQLDVVESLYIHLMQPEMNGERSSGVKASPIRFDRIIEMACAGQNLFDGTESESVLSIPVFQ